MPTPLVLIHARSVEDARSSRGNAMLVRIDDSRPPPSAIPNALQGQLQLIAVGDHFKLSTHPEFVSASRVGNTISIRRPDAVLIPALVNAHTHLDLTHIGPQPSTPNEGFQRFVDLVRSGRHSDPGAIAESVASGIDRCLKGGVVAVGDIAGAVLGRASTAAVRPFLRSPLRGVSFVEFFAIGARCDASLDALDAAIAELLQLPRQAERLWGISPHATNTVEQRAFGHARQLCSQHNAPLATHLAETPEERDLIASANGPQREFLERLGLWEDRLLKEFGHGETPVAHRRQSLQSGPTLAVHVNHATDDDLDHLAATQTTVVYCPRASEYFRAHEHFGPHRYREMLHGNSGRRATRVILGTDSIINLETPDRISTLDDARLLSQRDGVDSRQLLAMATTHAAEAIALDPTGFLYEPGNTLAGVVAVPIPDKVAQQFSPLDAVLRTSSCPELIVLGV